MLKSLILSALPLDRRAEMFQSFRGAKGHDCAWLRTRYLENGGARFPVEINKSFILVNEWTTDLRYLPRTLTNKEAGRFLSGVKSILHWADGTL